MDAISANAFIQKGKWQKRTPAGDDTMKLIKGSIKPPSVRYCTGGGFLLLNKTACVGYFALGAYRLFLF